MVIGLAAACVGACGDDMPIDPGSSGGPPDAAISTPIDGGGDGDTPAVDAALIPCPTFDVARPAVTVQVRQLTEAWGLVASTKNPGVLWTHNDAGDGPRIFAIRADGTKVAEIALGGAAKAKDWEDLAIGPDPAGNDSLYIGDIGDNDENRPSIFVYKIAEPSRAEPSRASRARRPPPSRR